ncbi:MAG: hypothetical protein R3F62_02110 [Planctomycetota bacterium]
MSASEEKTCGDCTACCGPTAMPLAGVFAAFERCQHAKPKGCGIYATRPQGCRNFECLWLLSDHWGAELRPDRCGFLARTVEDELAGLPPEQAVAADFSLEIVELPQGAEVEPLGRVLEYLHWVLSSQGLARFNVQFRARARDVPLRRLRGPFAQVADLGPQNFAWTILATWGLIAAAGET